MLALPDVVKAILDGFAQLPQMLFDIGANIIQGLIDGFLSMVGNVVDAIGSVIDADFGTRPRKKQRYILRLSEGSAWARILTKG